MDHYAMLSSALWAAVFAAALALFLTAPPRYLLPAFLCGFAGHVAQDLLADAGTPANLSTAAAALVITLVASALIRRREVVPVVLVGAVLPLGAGTAGFMATVGLMKVSTLEGAALDSASIELIANLGTVFMTSLAIALGIAAGFAIAGLSKARH